MAEKTNITPQEEELQTLAPTNDSTEFLIPDSGKKKLRVAEEGHEYKTFLTRKFLERKPWKAPDPLQVLSHIPGSVIEIFVKPGQKVKKGDKLMIYEAMKMMNIVSAPMDGTIKEVNAKEGEKLPKGALLVTFKKPAKK